MSSTRTYSTLRRVNFLFNRFSTIAKNNNYWCDCVKLTIKSVLTFYHKTKTKTNMSKTKGIERERERKKKKMSYHCAESHVVRYVAIAFENKKNKLCINRVSIYARQMNDSSRFILFQFFDD